jgi:prophage antirepressor-like protein
MADTMFNLFDKIFKYKGKTCPVIIDNDNVPWFSGKDIATFLEYENTTQAVRGNVWDIDKKPFGELYQFMDKIPTGSQDTAIYINETGFYCLVFGSRKEVAVKFKMWVLRTVLPSIRQFGSYQLEQKYIVQLDQLRKQLKSERSKNRALENNQKRQKFPDGCLVYALERQKNNQNR